MQRRLLVVNLLLECIERKSNWIAGSYCSQSSKYSTPTTASKLVELEPVLEAARKAKENGSTRFCMGAAWRDLAGRKRGFERILEMVRQVRGMDMEVCTTLGMLSPDQARQLKEA
jgi:biotin synthase